ncbi:hypothetical protein EDB84DRAFT_1680399 [Lactarius hengduanensis]|nr:hypothetical protein EDB84DRAFT_1680399 [Lactarius hengduanensis]
MPAHRVKGLPAHRAQGQGTGSWWNVLEGSRRGESQSRVTVTGHVRATGYRKACMSQYKSQSGFTDRARESGTSPRVLTHTKVDENVLVLMKASKAVLEALKRLASPLSTAKPKPRLFLAYYGLGGACGGAKQRSKDQISVKQDKEIQQISTQWKYFSARNPAAAAIPAALSPFPPRHRRRRHRCRRSPTPCRSRRCVTAVVALRVTATVALHVTAAVAFRITVLVVLVAVIVAAVHRVVVEALARCKGW